MLADNQIKEITSSNSSQEYAAQYVVLNTSFARLINNNFLLHSPIPFVIINKQEAIDATSKGFKRAFDILFSFGVMLLGLPVFALVALVTFVTSKGPVFYKQERIGLKGKPFYIYKFRSMRTDAENLGPQLASDSDPRITTWGRFMRKTRLDELPQFWNVLKGDMAVVGPRPERAYFIEKIVEKAPNYKRLLSIKPGITSLGQVCYGYAQTVDEMCERMLLDLQYLQDVRFTVDLAIIFRTVKVMIQGKGK